jgi:hypothetical protein
MAGIACRELFIHGAKIIHSACPTSCRSAAWRSRGARCKGSEKKREANRPTRESVREITRTMADFLITSTDIKWFHSLTCSTSFYKTHFKSFTRLTDFNLLKVTHYMFRPIRSSSRVLKLQIINEETALLPYRGFGSLLCGPFYAHVYL